MGHRGPAPAPGPPRGPPAKAAAAAAGPAARRPRGGGGLPAWLPRGLACLPLERLLGPAPPRRLAAPPGAAAPAAPAPEEAAAPAGGGRLLPLDVGFARVELEELGHWPWHELRILARQEVPTDVGIVALLEHLDFVLDLAQVCTGFMLTYNIEELGQLQMDVVMRIICWSSEAGRQAKWQQRCLCWKIVIPDSLSFEVARYALGLTFLWSPPPCIMYLVMDTHKELTLGDSVVCYHPGDTDTMDVKLLNEMCRVGGKLAAALPFAEQDPQVEEQGGSKTSASNQEPPRSSEGEAAAAPSGPPESGLPALLELGSVQARQGWDAALGMGSMVIVGLDAEIVEEEMGRLTGFLDDFVDSPTAARGFAMTYDLRCLRTPSMSMVMRLAEWGSEPSRQEKWQRLNLVCKVVVNSGVRYSLAKGVLSTFFFLCPPVCRTYLITELDQPEETSVIFEPVKATAVPEEPPPAAAPQAPSGARGAAAETAAEGPARPKAPTAPEDTDWMLLTAYDF